MKNVFVLFLVAACGGSAEDARDVAATEVTHPIPTGAAVEPPVRAYAPARLPAEGIADTPYTGAFPIQVGPSSIH